MLFQIFSIYRALHKRVFRKNTKGLFKLFLKLANKFPLTISVGKIKYLVRIIDVPIFIEIFQDKIYDFFQLKPGQTVIDVGAHVGFFTLKASNAVGATGKVIALEPSSNNYAFLIRNIALNKSNNITPLKLGLFKKTGQAKLYTEHGLNTGGNSLYKPTFSYELIPVTNFEYLLRLTKSRRINLLKMDVEGAELEILKSASKKDLKKIDCMVIEVHKDVVDVLELENLLRKNGFKCLVCKDCLYSFKHTIPATV